MSDIKKSKQRDIGLCIYCEVDGKITIAHRKVRPSHSSTGKEYVCERHIIEKGCLK